MSSTLHASPLTPSLLVTECCPMSLCHFTSQLYSLSRLASLLFRSLHCCHNGVPTCPPSRAVSSDLRTTRLLVVPYYLCVRFLSVSAAVLCLGLASPKRGYCSLRMSPCLTIVSQSLTYHLNVFHPISIAKFPFYLSFPRLQVFVRFL